MLPLAARRALIPLLGVLAAACSDATAPDRPAAAPTPPTATTPAVASHDPVPALTRGAFVALVGKRFQGTAQEAQANAWAGAAYPSPAAGNPDCAAARQLASLTLQYLAANALRGQSGNPPHESDPTVVPNDAAHIVNTALSVGCVDTVVPSNLFAALGGDGAAAFVFAGTGGTLKTRLARGALVIPPGALPSDALVMIVPLAGYTLPTALPQGGPYYELLTYPSFAKFHAPVSVEIAQSDASSLTSDNTILAHVPTGSSTIQPAASVACSQLGIGTFPVYTASVPAAFSSADGAFGGASPTAALIGGAVRCGTVESLSPFGTIQVVSTGFNRALLDLQACGTSATGRRFRALNKSGQEVVVFRAGTTNGTTFGKKVPVRVGPGSVASPAGAVFELPASNTAARLYYGPLTVKTVAATAGAPSC